jgi:AhpD family alkylhydroperoxidase
MRNPLFVLPEAMQALLTLNDVIEKSSVPYVTHKLVHLRASQINGFSVCVDMHSRELKKADQKDERIFAVAAWRDAPYFTSAERAALALTEAVTRLSDRADPVLDEVWQEAARHLNVSVKQVAGATWS